MERIKQVKITTLFSRLFPSKQANTTNLNQVTFEGITDPNFKNNKTAAELYYAAV